MRSNRRFAVYVSTVAAMLLFMSHLNSARKIGPAGVGRGATAPAPRAPHRSRGMRRKTPRKTSPGKSTCRAKGMRRPSSAATKIFVVSCDDEEAHERLLLCYDRHTGKELWRQVVLKSPLEKKHGLNSFASSTPATDGKLIYLAFLEVEKSQTRKQATPGMMVVAAYDMDGKQKWLVRPGPFNSVHGFCTCPVLFEDKVIVNGDHDGDSYIAAAESAILRRNRLENPLAKITLAAMPRRSFAISTAARR